ncbi:hypothetical protein ACIB15232_2012 [Aliarcobacter cibarius]|uniref:hypothetical protein n=1 Tax=Aliarcobacter cibarius TaxID=255507 RepID=UPI0012474800|nr:hypothetical protein [Aliarcobacter cibarius]QEZ90093.1 hypothetical protein ACIB15232_2012 [Aliarcobacter cibarius]
MKLIFFIFIFNILLFADNLVLQKQNTLYIQNLIEKEEQIAKAYEKYLLEEFKIPTIEDLNKNDIKNLYLGTNFSLVNILGFSLNIIPNELKLIYAIKENSQEYIQLLYERDLYRNYTTINVETKPDKSRDLAKSYVEINLKSKEAENIFNILKSGNNITIAKNCSNKIGWCNLNKNIIKFYNNNGEWIEYSKKDFLDSNVNVSSVNIFNDLEIKNRLKTGTNIFVKNTAKYIKYYDDIIKVK